MYIRIDRTFWYRLARVLTCQLLNTTYKTMLSVCTISLNCTGIWFRWLFTNWQCLDNWIRRISVNWNCPEKRFGIQTIKCNYPHNLFRRRSINWNCPENIFGILSIIWDCPHNWLRRRSINWNCPDKLEYCLLIGIAHTFDLEGGLFIGIVRTIDSGYCLLLGIARTIDLEGGLLIRIVGIIYVRDCLLIELTVY